MKKELAVFFAVLMFSSINTHNLLSITVEEVGKKVKKSSENKKSSEKKAESSFKLYTGIIFGMNYTANYQYNASGEISPNSMLIVEYPFLEKSSAALEFGYFQRKWDVTDYNNESVPVTVDFFTTQLNLRQRLEVYPVQPYLLFGFYMDYYLSGNFKSGGNEYDYTSGEYIKNLIYGTVWGVGGEYSFNKWGEVFLELGLLVPFNEPVIAKSNAVFEQEKGYYQDYFVNLGYKFNLMKFF